MDVPIFSPTCSGIAACDPVNMSNVPLTAAEGE
jgi:hypothetical protein